VTFQTTRRVEFRDTDAAGIVHFSAFFPMMEAAEHELLRSLGLSVMPRALSGRSSSGIAGQANLEDGKHDGARSHSDLNVTWPRVSASCQYLSAVRFEDLLEIEVRVAKIGNTSVQYAFRFLRDGKLLAEGNMTSVCCRLYRGGSPASSGQGDGVLGHRDQSGCDGGIGDSENEVRLEKTPIPDEIRQLLMRYQ